VIENQPGLKACFSFEDVGRPAIETNRSCDNDGSAARQFCLAVMHGQPIGQDLGLRGSENDYLHERPDGLCLRRRKPHREMVSGSTGSNRPNRRDEARR
jgi:hypothetical protein